jgi:hypothetical protein
MEYQVKPIKMQLSTFRLRKKVYIIKGIKGGSEEATSDHQLCKLAGLSIKDYRDLAMDKYGANRERKIGIYFDDYKRAKEFAKWIERGILATRLRGKVIKW